MRYAIAFLLLFAAGAFGQVAPIHYDYASGCAESIRTGKPLVVFVGHRPLVDVPDAVHATRLMLEGYPAQCVVVSLPENGVMYWKATLPMTAKASDIAKAVKPAAIPFDPFSPSSQRSIVQAVVEDREGSRSLRFHAGHNCPSCGAYRNVITGAGPNGTHTHRCERCNLSWYH